MINGFLDNVQIRMLSRHLPQIPAGHTHPDPINLDTMVPGPPPAGYPDNSGSSMIGIVPVFGLVPDLDLLAYAWVKEHHGTWSQTLPSSSGISHTLLPPSICFKKNGTPAETH